MFLLVMTMAVSAGCTHRAIPSASEKAPISSDNSYMDLEPGWKLRILVPLKGSAGELDQPGALHDESGNTITLSGRVIVGYELSYYSVLRRRNGHVQLKFLSATRTLNSKTEQETKSPELPFPLPKSAEQIRLVYHVALSGQTDHRMAIVASRRPDVLNRFTNRLNKDPSICGGGDTDSVSCLWVPAGVAVRPERE